MLASILDTNCVHCDLPSASSGTSFTTSGMYLICGKASHSKTHSPNSATVSVGGRNQIRTVPLLSQPMGWTLTAMCGVSYSIACAVTATSSASTPPGSSAVVTVFCKYGLLWRGWNKPCLTLLDLCTLLSSCFQLQPVGLVPCWLTSRLVGMWDC